MGDRCSVEIAVRREDLAKWEELNFFEEEVLTPSAECVWLHDPERNYGMQAEEDDLVPGSPMFGLHHEGGDYGAGLFAWDGEEYMERETDRNRNIIVVVDPDTGEACVEDLVDAKAFIEFSRKVGEMVGEAPHWAPPLPGQSVRYREYTIKRTDPRPPVTGHDWCYTHDDYDGPGDRRCGTAATVQAAKEMVDDLHAQSTWEKPLTMAQIALQQDPEWH
ncbi:MAG: hypothetical protein ABI557_05745 [Aureliella sp.]